VFMPIRMWCRQSWEITYPSFLDREEFTVPLIGAARRRILVV